ncbi:MAG: 23S rRNA (uracil(1939)-C(5))-methyltransferase RlmD [bacterium]|nr:23S rRNA (uracil(1939)-C(5))-methyltransferase RlmD [bacterium]
MGRRIIQVEIEDLAFDGKAVAHLEGKVVFLDGGLPGETVTAEITRSKPRYSQATVLDITDKCDARIPAVCTHFDHCGGCTWQDLEYDRQLFFKKKQVQECLNHIGGLEQVEVDEVVPSENIFDYRNKMEFSFHFADESTFRLGLHRRGCYDDIFDLEKCHLQSDTASEIVHHVRDFVRQESIPVYDVKTHLGFMRFLMLREAKKTGQIMVNIVTNIGNLPGQDRLVEGLTREFPNIATIVHGQNGKKSNIAVSEIENVLYGPGFIEEQLFDCRFRIRANSFFQTNTLQSEVLYQTGFDLLDPRPTDRLLDLYCGTGSIGILLASRVAEVKGVELVEDAVRAAVDNADLNQIENISFYQGHVKEFLKSLGSEERQFDVVVIDPPRAGLHPKALKRTIALQPNKLLYISCNPATFARDAKEIVAAGYSVSRVKPVDMFPHTKHIELVALFAK